MMLLMLGRSVVDYSIDEEQKEQIKKASSKLTKAVQ